MASNFPSPASPQQVSPNALPIRFKDLGYINWLKVARGLLHVIDALSVPTARVMKAFLSTIPSEAPCTCTAGNIKDGRMNPPCGVCDPRLLVIKQAHRATYETPPGEIFWKNSNPSKWHNDYWEIAKCYIGPGQTASSGPKITDLWLNCSEFSPLISKPELLEDVREIEEQMFRSPKMTLAVAEVTSHFESMLSLLNDATLKTIPDLDQRVVEHLQLSKSDSFTEKYERNIWGGLIQNDIQLRDEFMKVEYVADFFDDNPDLLEKLRQVDAKQTEVGTLSCQKPPVQPTTDALYRQLGTKKKKVPTATLR